MPFYRIEYTRTTRGTCYVSAENEFEATLSLADDKDEVIVQEVREVTLPPGPIRLDEDYNLIHVASAARQTE